MMQAVREFTSDGVHEFSLILGEEREKVKPTQPSKVDENFLAKIRQLSSDTALTKNSGFEASIDLSRKFQSRLAFGQYLNQILPDLSQVQYENIGLWSWISAAYFDQLLKASNRGNTFELWSSYRYIPVEYSKFRYYRHLAFMSFFVTRRLGENASKLFLSRPLYEHSDTFEQLYTSDKDFLTTPALIDIAVELYLKPDGAGMKKSSVGRKTPGSLWRLGNIIAKQLLMNFDLHSMNKQQVYQLLPEEFEPWKAEKEAR